MPNFSEKELRLGIDLGGTKIEAAVLDETLTERFRRRVPTPQGDYDATLRAIAELVEHAQRATARAKSIGIGTPGALTREGRIKNANSTVLNGRALKSDLEQVLGREIRMENDANCLIRSETIDGAAMGSAVSFGVILGTGVGGAIAIGTHALAGANAIAGEWGHNALPWPQDGEYPGARCYCAKTGCIETLLSGPALHRLRESHGEAALDIYTGRLARGLASIVNVLDPQTIVLGGGVSNIDRLYEDVPSKMLPFVFSDTLETRIVRAKHGDSSGVRGAALLWE